MEDSDSMVQLCDILVDSTWLIRVAGPLAVSISTNQSLDKLEQEMTNSLQQLNLKKNDESQHEEGTDINIHLSRGLCGVDEEAQGSGINHEPEKKRQKLDTITQPQHLVIEVRAQGDLASQLVGCYPSVATDSGIIQGFDFWLTRGSQSYVDEVLGFLGCRNSSSVFRPTVADMARATTLWTTGHWHMTTKRNNPNKENEKGKGSEDSKVATKPLTLTYEVPSGPVGEAGLDSISLTVPPLALLRLCNDIMASGAKKDTCQQHSSQQATLDNTDTSTKKKESIPILKALNCFLRETFRIHIDKFSLTSASCSTAVLYCDGRCKPLCDPLLGMVLQEIRSMTTRSFDQEGE